MTLSCFIAQNYLELNLFVTRVGLRVGNITVAQKYSNATGVEKIIAGVQYLPRNAVAVDWDLNSMGGDTMMGNDSSGRDDQRRYVDMTMDSEGKQDCLTK